MERREFLQILYDALPDKSFVVTEAEITDVIEFLDRVEAHLADGTVQTGDMVLGCDGVHSLIRSIMWDHAGKKSPGLIKDEEKTCTSWLQGCRCSHHVLIDGLTGMFSQTLHMFLLFSLSSSPLLRPCASATLPRTPKS